MVRKLKVLKIITARQTWSAAKLIFIEVVASSKRIEGARVFDVPDNIDIRNDEIAKLFLGEAL